MTDLSRGVRSRRSGRRPGWLLLSVLLVLAIAASSALVFTERVELLKLAVILSLWAAATAAFVSVIYRRQSDLDRAKARDLKLVYDLQLDREISARREYELEVESQLRRELASELRAQATEEVAELRAELAALRTNLEILFDADLSHRPAIEPDRTTVRAYSDWQRDTEITDPGRNIPRFVESTPGQDAGDGSEQRDHRRARGAAGSRGGARRRGAGAGLGPPGAGVDPAAAASRRHMPSSQWKSADGTGFAPSGSGSPLLPKGSGFRRARRAATGCPPTARPRAAEPPPPPVPPEPAFAEAGGGRHSNPAEPAAGEQPPQEQPQHGARHGALDDVPAESQHGEGHGQSVAELLARLQAGAEPTGGGRRRRRDG